MMSKANTASKPHSPKALSIQVSLEDHLSKDRSFPSEYLRAVAAIASADGTVNLAEYAALNEIAKLTGESALAGVMLLHAIDHRISTELALERLLTSSESAEHSVAAACFEAAKPLLALQGSESRDIAKRLATALRHPASEAELDDVVSAESSTLWNIITRKTLQVVRGNGLVEFAEECYRVTGEKNVLKNIRAFQSGKVEHNALRECIVDACDVIMRHTDDYEETLRATEIAEAAAQNFVASVNKLEKQVQQRLAIVEARIQFERQTFLEDMEDAIHDAGNAIELDVSDRLKIDQVKLPKVWESIGRTSFGKELERRIDRIVSRREKTLRLLKEDLRLFQEDMRLSSVSILQQRHHTHFTKLMPPLRIRTRIANTVEDAADVTIGVGILSLAGTGAAAYALGTAVVLPLIAPIAPFVGGAMVVAGVIKWLSDSAGRKDKEIRHKREAFEKALREQLEGAQVCLDRQLDDLANEFLQTGKNMLEPLMLEAQASVRLNDLQVKTAKRLIKQSRTAVTEVITKVAALPA